MRWIAAATAAGCLLLNPVAASRSGAFPVATLDSLPATAFSAVSPPAAARAPRALWVVRGTLASREDTERAVEACARIGCSLLFLQVSGRWDAWFPSRVFPAGEALPAGEGDNLARAVDLAHARGIRVHAWVNALLAWSAPRLPRDPRHVVRVHPEWFLTGPDGRSILQLDRAELDRRRLEGWFLEPGIPEVRTELRRFVLDLVTRYDLDGVHLDYIRLPSAGWGFNPALRERYRAERGLDPRDLFSRGDARARERGTEWLEEERARWRAWHREGVTDLVRLVARDLDAVRPGLELSAAVLADPRSARDDFGQDWVGWLNEGTLNLAVPMVYRRSAQDVLRLLETIGRAAGGEARVYAGVSLEFLHAGEVPPIENLMDRTGADGLAIFSWDLLRQDRRALELLSER